MDKALKAVHSVSMRVKLIKQAPDNEIRNKKLDIKAKFWQIYNSLSDEVEEVIGRAIIETDKKASNNLSKVALLISNFLRGLQMFDLKCQPPQPPA